ncbi:hypothetical protein JK205_11865 [Gluconobacter cerinus]|nr:hypothetical protein [Gluconobacter cerinus]
MSMKNRKNNVKRPWLTTSLLAVIAGMSAIGIHHAASVALDRGISRFRASLPVGATLSYSAARPAILARGALLTDVILQNGNMTFRAHTLRLGHPIPTPDGGLTLSHMDMVDPSLQTPTAVIRAHSVTLNHLVTPPAPAGKSGLESLDLGHLNLERGYIDHLSVQNLSQVLQPNSMHFNSLTSDSIQIDGYGPGRTTTIAIQNGLAIASRTTLQPDGTPRAMSVQMSLKNFQLRQPELATRIAYEQAGNEAAAYALPPLESMKLSGTQIISADRTFSMDTLIGTGTRKSGKDTTVFEGEGFHTHSSSGKVPVHIDGHSSTLKYTQERIAQTGELHVQGVLNIPNFTEAHFGMNLLGPSDQQLKVGTVKNPHDAIQLAQVTLTLHGDRLVQSLPSLNAGRPLDGAAQDQARTVLAQGMEMGLSPYPALAALPDYFANPNDRTLSITLTPKPPLTLTALAAIASSPTAAMTLMSPDNLKVTVQ